MAFLPDAPHQLDYYYNQSYVGYFVIVGGELGLKHFYIELSVLLLAVYIIVIIGNLTVFTVVILDTKLHTPMYIFLSNLSIIDIVITTSVLPKMIMVCLWNDVIISFSGCFLQLYFYLAFQSVESFVLTAMSFDRYVAICNPLRYNDIVTPRTATVKNLHPNVLIMVSIVNCFLTPFVNPIIYSFRNKDLKTAIRKQLHFN
ncbi:hypothetical protein SKAU_G00085110 [Synaphobranchus kaupii]|uniref:G-protein coupled receptors family 1 profile domain-containing protein n=1 Tax=Synaphobranchus kaupii TaxID=118154 RepID=A0A9Q1FVG1_SYNKA|nr:hypothetical protein SKAU_G00085110 [Synaphobranchus kaupii]